MNKKISALLLLFISLAGSAWTTATPPDQKQVLKNADLHLGGMIPGISWNIHLENFENDKSKNDLKLYVEASTINDQRLALVTFLEPKKVEGQKLLIRANNMWFTKKGLSQPMAISGRQRLSGAAANADIASASYSIDYNIVGVQENKLGNDDCYVFDLEAKNNLVSYAKIKIWVTKTENTAVKAEYFAKSSDKIIKSALFEYGLNEVYNGAKTRFVSKITISDHIDTSNKTVLNVSGVKFPGFDNSKFDKNNL